MCSSDLDDDGGGGYNALLQTVLPASGNYMLLANTYTSGQSGRYRLELSSASGGGAAPSPSTGRSIVSQSGALQQGDRILPDDDSLYDEYEFSGRAGQTVEISITSTEFDTYAILVDASGASVEQNDDAPSGGTTNSYMVVRLPATGRYTVLVNSYDNTGRGNYNLEVRSLD